MRVITISQMKFVFNQWSIDHAQFKANYYAKPQKQAPSKVEKRSHIESHRAVY